MKTKIVAILLMGFAIGGCHGVNRLINGPEGSPAPQPTLTVGGGATYEPDPSFNLTIPQGMSYTKLVGVYAPTVTVDTTNLAGVYVMIKSAGHWFQLGVWQDGMDAPTYTMVGGVVTFKNIIGFNQYCIYRLTYN